MAESIMASVVEAAMRRVAEMAYRRGTKDAQQRAEANVKRAAFAALSSGDGLSFVAANDEAVRVAAHVARAVYETASARVEPDWAGMVREALGTVDKEK